MLMGASIELAYVGVQLVCMKLADMSAQAADMTSAMLAD